MALMRFEQGEEYILACILQHPEVFPFVKETLSNEDFTGDFHQALFGAYESLVTSGSPVELPTVAKVLHDQGGASAWQEKLLELFDAPALTPNIGHYVNELVKYSQLRKLQRLSDWIKIEAIKPDADPADIASKAQMETLAAVNLTNKAECVSEKDGFSETWNFLHDDSQKESVKTGFYDLDSILIGLIPGDLHIVCARPGVGKTAFMLDISLNVGRRQTVFFYSLEMNRFTVMARIISKRTGIPANAIIHRRLTDPQKILLDQAVDKFRNENLWIDTSIGLTPSRLQAKITSQALKVGKLPDLVIVDYLQYMHPDIKTQNREREIASISNTLKELALHFECPFLVASQLSRAIEGRALADRKPKLSDLRESGSIEQDASIVLGLSRLDGAETAICGVLKSRHGALGEVELVWDGPTTSFRSLERIFN